MAGFYGSSLICLFSFIMCVYKSDVVDASLKSTSIHTCDDVSKVFEKLKSTEGVPVKPITAPTLDVCADTLAYTPGGVSCCTSGMESQFMVSAEEYLRQHLSKLNQRLMYRITYTQDKYLELLEASLVEAQNSTSDILETLFRIPKDVHGADLYDLFAKFRQYIQGREIVLEDVLSNFFDQMFPHVFKYVFIDQTQVHLLDKGFANCLMDYSDDIKPFGRVPDHLGKKIKQAFHRARVVMETMRVMHHVINFTNSFKVDNHCKKAITRLEYCPWCSSYTSAKPCRGLCLNVFRGCLSATVTDLSSHWDDLVMAFENLEVDQPKGKDFQDVVGFFSTNVSEAVLNAMADMERIHEDVKSLCSDFLQGQGSSGPNKKFSTYEGITKSSPGRTPSVRSELVLLIRELDESKGVFLRMADGVCRDPALFTDIDSNGCWNGSAIGGYTQMIPEASILSQARVNPEVRVNITVDRAVLHIKDKIDQTRRNLSKLLNEEKMQSDSTFSDTGVGYKEPVGSGQDTGYGSVGDDTEDDEDGGISSGSGSGDGPDIREESDSDGPKPPDHTGHPTGPKSTKKPTYTINESEGGKQPNDGQKDNGVSPLSTSSLVSLLCLLVIALIQSEC